MVNTSSQETQENLFLRLIKMDALRSKRTGFDQGADMKDFVCGESVKAGFRHTRDRDRISNRVKNLDRIAKLAAVGGGWLSTMLATSPRRRFSSGMSVARATCSKRLNFIVTSAYPDTR